MLRGLEGWHLLILIGVIAVLFGYKRMPDAARSLGRSMRILKAEVAPMHQEPTFGEEPEKAPEHPAQG